MIAQSHRSITLAGGALWMCAAMICGEASTAHAQSLGAECGAGGSCDEGLACEQVGTVGCPASPCSSDGTCEPAPPCEEEPYHACIPVRCDPTQAGGCGTLVCKTFTLSDCPAGAPGETVGAGGASGGGSGDSGGGDAAGGAPGAPPPPPDEECESHSESFCVPPYIGPCAADADCGPGFSCVEIESCACHGGAGSTGAGGYGGVPSGAGGEGGEPECVCEPSGESWCRVDPIPCETDGDCEDGTSCQELGSSVICENPDEPDPGFGGAPGAGGYGGAAGFGGGAGAGGYAGGPGFGGAPGAGGYAGGAGFGGAAGAGGYAAGPGFGGAPGAGGAAGGGGAGWLDPCTGEPARACLPPSWSTWRAAAGAGSYEGVDEALGGSRDGGGEGGPATGSGGSSGGPADDFTGDPASKGCAASPQGLWITLCAMALLLVSRRRRRA